jgi:hypothetical protein
MAIIKVDCEKCVLTDLSRVDVAGGFETPVTEWQVKSCEDKYKWAIGASPEAAIAAFQRECAETTADPECWECGWTLTRVDRPCPRCGVSQVGNFAN